MHIDLGPVRIHISFFLTAFILGWGIGDPWRTVVWVVIVLLGVLLHEAGHAAAARAFGLRATIELGGLGGVTRFQGGRLRTWQRVAVTLAGPLAGFSLGGALLVLYLFVSPFLTVDLLSFALKQSLIVNIGWGAFNLLPVLPLDGGQVGLALLSRRDPQAGLRRMSLISVVVAGLVVAAALSVGMVWIGLLFGFLGFISVRTLISARTLDRDRDADMAGRLKQARQLVMEDPAEALAAAAQIKLEAGHPVNRAAASQLMALALLRQGDAGAALHELDAIPASHRVDQVLLHRCLAGAFEEALARGDAEDVCRTGERLYGHDEHAETAYRVAAAHARSGRIKPARQWLVQAATDGLDPLHRVDVDADLEPLRRRRDWPRLRATLERLAAHRG